MLGIKFLPSVNKVIKFFIISDLVLWSGWGVIDPLFSIFVVKNIAGATLMSIGYLAGIYWITKAIWQIPISLVLDRTKGEKDDFYALVFGLIITGLAAYSFSVAETINQIYFIQFIKAFGFALYIPAWSSIFSRHLDKEHSAFEWATDSSFVSLGIGAAGFLGGMLASSDGFKLLFLVTGTMAIASACILLFVPKFIFPKQKTGTASTMSDHVRAGLK